MTKNDSNHITKVFQFKFYSFLSSRWGMALCILGAFISFNTVFHLVSMYGVSTKTSHMINQMSDNVGGHNYQSILCAEPIDIVYTWVNGSDPQLIKAVTDLKRRMRDPTIPECQEKQDPNKHKCYRDDNPPSRYIDNQELKYSLRSVEQFAPWVRHVFLVTNGQVPNWIDLSNPKLTVVTHEEIFKNKSDLPTFSSPSIETHLHRIPGLSKKFLYLNDDVMFGRPVYPDDFLTQGGGQKVFLSWPVPNCNEGCPSNWIGDGFCDAACNVTLCDFDAGDCDNSTGKVKTRWSRGQSTGTPRTDSTAGNRAKNYCSRGCPDSWIGDTHCDRMCKNADCGFDAGDCGTELMASGMIGYEITNQTLINIANGTSAVYFNLTKLVGDASITDGTHDNVLLVRTASISQKHKMMTLTFHHNITFQNVSISITFEKGTGTEKVSITKDFNITLSTLVTPTEPPVTLPSNNTTAATAGATGGATTSPASTNVTNAIDPPQPGEGALIEGEQVVTEIQDLDQAQGESEDVANVFDSNGEEKRLFTNNHDEESKVILEQEQQQKENKDIPPHQRPGAHRGLMSFEQQPQPQPLQQQVDDILLPMRYVEPVQTKEDDSKYVSELLQSKAIDPHELAMKKYTLNREMEQTLRDEGEIYPWENIVAQEDSNNSAEMVSLAKGGQRKLLDMFADSLKYVNRLYTVEFGSSPRKVPAHMPHMIDRDLMEEIQQK
ncbi:hypothetical protein SAMD00019534_067390 [Acytostelium subglobosum LB1]|uniref:hypothetical protein n=1 Tax=Acytostelium subglobosum LB1 TaxID=1410327 RepID=UPI0006450D43|nr:hypothetical protein SAMD00019534_067390 [Acytostelium subglobosum LB1]GAM23564.1 hypothetical protein SAMD00019534_067390 [Acytostelium subglobosum LB1]|eukprot:XP_012753305.1 hypothetical protein SAMD00019534_067390 [Acytostelium subglobosum LB1]